MPRYVKTDAAKLRQVLVNLLGNAIKFTRKGGVILRVGCQPHPAQGESKPVLLFEVEDSGSGIAAGKLDHIFDPFVQAGNGQNPREGTGLGLPISRRYVQLMGGDINVTSEIDKGSIFSFQIEIEPATEEDLLRADRFREVVGLEPDQPEYRVLIVEDNPQNRTLLVKLMQPLGFRIREASNGQQGIDISEEWDPDLIFMDMRMPVMDGFEATRRIKNGSKGRRIKIVAVTASVFEHEKELVMNAGCDDFIRKPIRSEEIFETLARHLGVKFSYAEKPGQVTEQIEALDAEDIREHLQALPPEWTHRLNQAAVSGDIEKTAALAEEIRTKDRELSDALRGLLKQYSFDKIVVYTE